MPTNDFKKEVDAVKLLQQANKRFENKEYDSAYFFTRLAQEKVTLNIDAKRASEQYLINRRVW